MPRAFILCAFVVLAIAVGCNQSDIPLITPQPGAPCGNVGVVCYDNNAQGQLAPTGMCCWEGSVCGGGFPNVGCPAGQCCDVGNDFAPRSLDGGEDGMPAAQHPHHIKGPQWPSTVQR